MDTLLYIFSVILLLGTIFSYGFADPLEDKEALLDFLYNMPHSRPLNWNKNSSVCNNWTGVTCNHDQSRVIALRLPGFGFRGSIPPNTLSRLSGVQILSLRLNSLSGLFPSELASLGNLTALYLQHNKFSGPLPSNFSVCKNLAIVNLSDNGFNGSIPPSMSSLTYLTALDLANNSLSGGIPDGLYLPNLQHLNLSQNHLSGGVPKSLRKFPYTAYAGNNLSYVVDSDSPIQPAVPPNGQPPRKAKLGEPAILGIILGGCVLGFVLIAIVMVICCSNGGRESEVLPRQSQKGETTCIKKRVAEGQDGSSRLVFFEGCNLAFDLEDLLRASAEVLGKGTFGMTYRAALEDATVVVVKRLKEVNVTKREFEQQMEVAGSIKHENVSQLRAYYFSKDEKLMMYDYCTQGSISSMLHGKRGERRSPLDWDKRLKVAIGTARGIAHLHAQNGGKFVHGNIKASNIFLNPMQYGCISDFGLATLIGPAVLTRATGYRAPEVTDLRRSSQASDVYSFGVLLLELLTGKSPIHAASGGGDEVVHLVRWVHSVVREEWTAEVFDVELLRYPNIEEEMVEMLQIGMACVVRMPDQRPKMAEVTKMVEDVRRLRTGNRPSSETKSPPVQVAEMGSSSVSQ